MKYLKSLILLIFMCGISSSAYGQGAPDVLRYSLQYPENDPVSLVLPGVSDATGFGAYQQNPAVTALFDQSFVSASLSDRYVNEDGFYIRNTTSGDDNQVDIGNAGFVYNVPTKQGKLSIGAGYSQSHDFNRALNVQGRNNITTITDAYNSTPDDSLFFTAFDALAIDFANADSSFNETKSIFRFGPYQGITQNSESTQRGVLGEYSAFIASEFAKNLYLGASIGVINGSYSFKRNFLETDQQNNYTDGFTGQNGGFTGENNILSEDRVDETFTAFSLRLGAVYQFSDHFNIGAAYQFKNVLHIDEKFNTTITNTLDDGSFFQADSPAEFKFKVVRPARFNFGVTAKDLAGFTLSASGQRVAYSQGRIRFDSIRRERSEELVNSRVESNLDDVLNFRLGLQYKINEIFTPRLGYGYYPSPTKGVDNQRNFYSAGFTSLLSDDIQLNVGAQLARFNDQRTLYSTPQGDEVADEDVNHWHFMAGLRFLF